MMKVKIKLITLVLVLVVCLTLVLCACDNDTGLFTQNKERASKQITASAEFNGRLGVVDVNELYASFYNYYSYLYSYYSYGYITADQFQAYLDDLDTTFAESNESLGRTSLYTLKCIDLLYNHYKASCTDTAKVASMDATTTVNKTYDFDNMDELERFYKDRSLEISRILACSDDNKYSNQAIYYANQQLQSLYDEHIKDIKEEYEAIDPDVDETPSGFTGIELVNAPNRLVYEVNDTAINTAGMVVNAVYAEGEPVRIPNKYVSLTGFSASSAAENQTITVTYGKYSETFTVDIVAAYAKREIEETEDTDAETEEKIAELTDNNTKRLAPFSFEVKESDYIFDGQTEAEHAQGVQDYKIARTAMNRVSKSLEDNYRTYGYYLYVGYNTQIRQAAERFVESDVVVTKAQLDAKYNEKITEALEGYASTPYSKDTIENDFKQTFVHTDYSDDIDSEDYNGYFYVTQILFKFDDDVQAKIDEFTAEKVANEDALKQYRDSLAPDIVTWVTNTEYDAEATCTDADCNCARCENYVGEHVNFDTLEKWYGLYDYSNDPDYSDPCVTYSHGIRKIVCTCKACVCNKYLGKDSAMLAIDRLSDELDSKASISEKVEIFNKYIMEYNMDDGVFTYLKDGKPGYLMTPEGIDSGMVSEFDAKCRELVKNGVGSYGYCFTEYGIHFIMVDYLVTDGSNGTLTRVENQDYVQLGLNYITNPFAELEDDEIPVYLEGTATQPIKEGSVGYYIWQKLYADSCATAVSVSQKAFYDEYADTIRYFPKTYKSIVEDLQKNNDSTAAE